METNFRTKILDELMEYIREGNESKIKSFWQYVEEKHCPIVEEIEDEKEHSLITFFYRGDDDINNVMIFDGGIESKENEYEKNTMCKIENTNIWYKIVKVRSDMKSLYFLSPNYVIDGVEVENPEYIDDPLGIQKILLPVDEEGPEDKEMKFNIIEMPNSMKYYWTVEKENVPKGKVELLRIKNEETNDVNRVWVYTPSSYDSSKEQYKTMVLTDGFDYVVSTPTLLDNLIHENKIPPMVVIFVECEQKRNEVLQCDNGFSEFIVNKVLKECRGKYNLSQNAEDNIIGGISFGGLFASHIGLHYSHIFGNILSQSGSYWWYPEFKMGEEVLLVGENELNFIPKEYENKKNVNLRFYIEVGTLEGNMMIKGSRDLRDILISKGCSIEYSEFPGGHDYLHWKETLAKGLMFLAN